MTSRWSDNSFEYTEANRLRDSLIGREIVSTLSEGTDTDRVLTFVLDNGSLLKAHATDGGCACSNGCFTVEPGNVVKGTITGVEVSETETNWSGGRVTEVEPGSLVDGSATIRIFVYSDLGKQLLLTSEGGDNGYYGWGFWLSVHRPETPVE